MDMKEKLLQVSSHYSQCANKTTRSQVKYMYLLEQEKKNIIYYIVFAFLHTWTEIHVSH